MSTADLYGPVGLLLCVIVAAVGLLRVKRAPTPPSLVHAQDTVRLTYLATNHMSLTYNRNIGLWAVMSADGRLLASSTEARSAIDKVKAAS